MQIQLIRNATLRLEIAGKNILIDPMLGSKHAFESFGGIEKNPTVDLPLPVDEILRDLDLIIISHLHQDHFDAHAQEILDKQIPIFCQPADREKIESYAFENVTGIQEKSDWQGLQIFRTAGQHGTGQWAQRLNPVSGFVFQAPHEPTLYWIGDSVTCAEVESALESYKPDVIVAHSGGAEIEDSGPILMDAAQTIGLCQANPDATVIATHMDALDHCKTTRQLLKKAAVAAKIDSDQLLIPEDGQQIDLR